MAKAARPAAGKGGKAHSVPVTRADRLSYARAEGAAGRPAPPWIDDAEMLQSYSDGADTNPNWAGDTDSAYTETGGDNDGTGSNPAPAPSDPSPLPLSPGSSGKSGSGKGSRSIGPVKPTGAAGDAAGAFLGVIAAAFLTNVLKGTWTQWLKAKFLNSVPAKGGVVTPLPGGAGRTQTSTPSGTQVPNDTSSTSGNTQSLQGPST